MTMILTLPKQLHRQGQHLLAAERQAEGPVTPPVALRGCQALCRAAVAMDQLDGSRPHLPRVMPWYLESDMVRRPLTCWGPK